MRLLKLLLLETSLPVVTNTAKVYDTSAGVQILDLDAPSDNEALPANLGSSMQQLELKMQELNRRIQALDR